MSGSARHSASVLICTYNRAALLRETLDSLDVLRSARSWDLVIVDNNSDDETRAVIEAFAARSAVPVLYLFEPRQGKSYALNTGLARTRGDIIVFTDDDVRVEQGWLDAACRSLDEDSSIDYTGGPVYPLWEAEPPPWLDRTRGDLWGTLAILDYGREPFVFEERQRVPLGANMAVRRTLIERIGGFHPELGRRGRSLLGQEQAEFFARARAHGARGVYVPAMRLHHHVPAVRLTKQYFRRWWFWKGVSRARVDAMHHCTELGLDLREVPYVIGVPRFVWGLVPRAAARWTGAVVTRNAQAAARYEMRVAYAIGYVRGCWGTNPEGGAAPYIAGQESASL